MILVLFNTCGFPLLLQHLLPRFFNRHLELPNKSILLIVPAVKSPHHSAHLWHFLWKLQSTPIVSPRHASPTLSLFRAKTSHLPGHGVSYLRSKPLSTGEHKRTVLLHLRPFGCDAVFTGFPWLTNGLSSGLHRVELCPSLTCPFNACVFLPKFGPAFCVWFAVAFCSISIKLLLAPCPKTASRFVSNLPGSPCWYVLSQPLSPK